MALQALSVIAPALPPQPKAAPQIPPVPLWLCCHFPDLPLEAALDIKTPTLGTAKAAATPAAVWQEVSGRPLIHAATPSAEAAGIRPGLPLNAALALCAQLHLARRDEPAERQALQTLAETALAYTAWVSLDYPDALLLEIRGSLNLFGGAESLVRQVREHFRNTGHRVVAAVAPAPCSAWLLSRAGREAIVEDPAALRSRLGDLSMGHLPVERNTLERLAKAGLRNLRDLWRLPRDGLSRRYGVDLLRWLGRAAGVERAPPRLFRPPARFHGFKSLAAETEHLPFLLPVAELLLAELAEFLRGHDGVTDRVELQLLHFRNPATVISLQLRQGSRDPARLAALLNERLERTPLPAPVIALGLNCGQVLPHRVQAVDLFSVPLLPGAIDWEALLEQLEQRLGRESLRFLSTHADHRPERAWRYRETPLAEATGQPGRPLWLLTKPRPCNPRRFRLSGERERIESGWWDGDEIRRDYYTGVDRHGTRAWLYRDLGEPNRWWVQGVFG